MGAIVDHVDRIFHIPEDQIETAPEMAAAEIRQYISGVGKMESGLVVLLDSRKVLTDDEIIQLKELETIKTAIKDRQAAEAEKKKKADKTDGPSQETKKKKRAPARSKKK